MAEGNDGDPKLVELDGFEGELDEDWQDAKGLKVLDSSGDEVGVVEELYVWEDAQAVHLIEVSGDERRFLIPVDAVTNVSEDGVEVEQGKNTILGSPEFDSEDVPGSEASRAAHDYYGYADQLFLGGV